jgi:hypothetical protein
MKKKGVRMNQPTSSSWLSNGSGKAATRYIDANQQCSKDNNSKGHNRGKNIDQVCSIFMGAPCLEFHCQLVPNLGAQRVKSPGPLMFDAKDCMAKRILLSTIAQETKTR